MPEYHERASFSARTASKVGETLPPSEDVRVTTRDVFRTIECVKGIHRRGDTARPVRTAVAHSCAKPAPPPVPAGRSKCSPVLSVFLSSVSPFPCAPTSSLTVSSSWHRQGRDLSQISPRSLRPQEDCNASLSPSAKTHPPSLIRKLTVQSSTVCDATKQSLVLGLARFPKSGRVCPTLISVQKWPHYYLRPKVEP